MTEDKGFTLINEFPAVTTEQWESAIQTDLKGAEYDKKLLWKTDEKITVHPSTTKICKSRRSTQSYPR